MDIHLELDVDNFTLEMPMDVGSQIIRIVQEALINARKHAQVTEVFISIQRQVNELYISIEDCGQGFDMAQIKQTSPNGKSGLGLEIMRERAESIGGHIQIESAPGKGTTVSFWIPVRYRT